MVADMMTLAMTYYEAPQMLREHLAAWRDYPPGIRLVLVDDGSQRAPADLSACPIPYEHWRITEDWPWNQNAARNLAMSRASGKTLVTDMDHLLTAAQAHAAVHARLKVGEALRPERVWPSGEPTGKRHPNTYLLHAEDYWAAGGYDETLCGYYGTDAKFRRQLQRAGVAIRDTDAFALTLYEGVIDDACADLPRKGSRYHARQRAETWQQLRDATPTAAANRFLFAYEYIDGG